MNFCSSTGLLWVAILAMFAGACKSKSSNEPIVDGIDPQISLLNEKIEDDPNNANLYFARSQAQIELNEYSKAIADLQRAIAIDSLKPSYYQVLSDVYIAREDSERAVESLEAGLHYLPGNVEITLQLARLYLTLKEYKRSDALLTQLLSEHPRNADAWFYRAKVSEENSDTAKAIRFYKRAIEQDAEYFEAYSKLGVIYTNQGNEMALLYYDNALRIDPSNIQMMLNKGHFYRHQKDWPNAISRYKEVVIKEPSNEQVYKNLGYCYLEMDSLAKAYRFYDLATKFEPANPDNFYGKAIVAERRASVTKNQDSARAYLQSAKRDFENVLGLSGQDVDAYDRIQIVNKKLESL